MRIDWSAHALSDLKRISEYLEAHRSLEVANRISRAIYEAVQGLVSMPHLGRSGRVVGTRELSVAPLPHLIVYRVLPGRLLILNILHGAQRWP
jgi:toxin ParE1/3/4